jgi:hypothetical protein
MDFVLVTPDFVTLYNQEWLTYRNIRTLESNRIKGITVDKKWLLRSIFNFWTLVFYSDGSKEWETEIHIPYIKNPENTKDMILKVIVPKQELEESLLGKKSSC